MSVSLEQFIRYVEQSGLLTRAELVAFLENFPRDKRPRDGQALLVELVRLKRLTRYQAQTAAQGKIQTLVFGEYRILDKLGQGGMGVVYKAEHRRMGRQVAVKVLPAATMRSHAAVQRFYLEIKAVARLSHPNIVTAYDAGEHDGMHYLVMEYVDGHTMTELVKDHGPMPVGQAVQCILQAAKGLKYAHDQGITHRDIKPSNLIVDKNGTVKILDLGLARIEERLGADDPTADDRLTRSGQVMGTCDYMAPEQALNTRRADHRADIYALGCTLFRLLAGRPPYRGQTEVEVIVAHREGLIPSLCVERDDVPPDLDACFQKMVAKRPEERQSSMAEVIAELEESLAGDDSSHDSTDSGFSAFIRNITESGTATRHQVQGVTARTMVSHAEQETGTHLGVKLARSGNRRPALWIALGSSAVVLTAVALLLVLLTRGQPEAKPVAHAGARTPPVAVADPSAKLWPGIQPGAQETLPAAKAESGEPGGAGAKGQSDKGAESSPPGTATPESGPSSNPQPPAPSPESPASNPQSPTPNPSPYLDANGNWKLPPGAPGPAAAPFDAAKAKDHQEAWAKHLGIPVELTNSIGMKFILIPPGEFDMGSTPAEIEWALDERNWTKDEPRQEERVAAEAPRHRVRISRPFYLGIYHVTQAEYAKVIGLNPSAFCANQMDVSTFQPPLTQRVIDGRLSRVKAITGKDTSQYPVETVSWSDATEFCRRLSAWPAEKTARRDYRLATEAEWEYACRAGTATRWHSGDDPDALHDYSWFRGGGSSVRPVGGKQPNAWGLFDMHGMVRQWCSDWYGAAYYGGSPSNDPLGPLEGKDRVTRGGIWWNSAPGVRSAVRASDFPGSRFDAVGMRVALEITDESIKAWQSSQPKKQPIHDLADAQKWMLDQKLVLRSPYLIQEAETGFAKQVDDLGKLTTTVSAAERAVAALERSIDDKLNQIAALQRKSIELEAHVNTAAKANNVRENNYWVSAANACKSQIHLLQEEIEKDRTPLREKRAAAEKCRTQFVPALVTARQQYEELDRRYEQLRADSQLSLALAQLGQNDGKTYDVGPSPKLRAAKRGLEKLGSLYVTEEIPIRRDRGGTWIVKVKLNGKYETDFEIHTGSSSSGVFMTWKAAEDAGLDPANKDLPKENVKFGERKVSCPLVTADSVSVGKFTGRNVEIDVIPNGTSGACSLDKEFLERFNFKLDPNRSRLILTQFHLDEIGKAPKGKAKASGR